MAQARPHGDVVWTFSEVAQNNPHIVRDEIDKQLTTQLMKEASKQNMFGMGQMERPGTYEVEYKTSPEAKAPTTTEIIPADNIFVNDSGEMVFAAGQSIQVSFPADRLVSLDHLQNVAPFKDFLHADQRDFVNDHSDRVALLPRSSGATTTLAATALDRAYEGKDVLYLCDRERSAQQFIETALHNAAVEMSVDVKHVHDTAAGVGDAKVWSGTYGLDPSPLMGRQPDVLLGDRLEEQESKHVKPILEDSHIEETAFTATGGREMYGPESGIRQVLWSGAVENVYWFAQGALDRIRN